MSFDPILEPSSLGDLSSCRLLDARGAEAFDAGHAAGAVRVPVEAWTAAAGRPETGFDNTAYWEAAVAALGAGGNASGVGQEDASGVGQDPPVVVYDDGGMTEAARVWFILQYFGVVAFILNGGFPALEERPDLLEPVRIAPPAATFRAHPDARRVGLIERRALKDRLADVRIFDARTAAEYVGEDLRKNPRGGRLPGAVSIPHAMLLADGRVKPAAALRDLLTDEGLFGDDPIVAHCDAGGRAALAAAAAVRAGRRNVHVYYLSFSDWAADESCPIASD